MGLALALWALEGWSARQVRAAVSDWRHTGAAASGWRSLARWTRQVAAGRLFSGLQVPGAKRPREVAAWAAQALCGWAPPQTQPRRLSHLAFAGACHVS